MRLGIKGKQILYVTSIVGGVVVVLSVDAPGPAHARQPRGEQVASRAPRERHLPPRARSRGRGRRSGRGPPRRSRPPVDSRVERSTRTPWCLPRSWTRRALPWRMPTRRVRACRFRAPRVSNELLSRAPIAELAAIYFDQGRTLELRKPLLLGNVEFGSIRIGVSTLLIRQRARRLAPALGGDRAGRPADLRVRGDAAGAAVPAADSRDQERPHAPRPRRVRRAARSEPARRVR